MTNKPPRKTRQVYFTAQELPQVDNILEGREFSRWVREKLAEEAAKMGKPFDNDLPMRGKYKR